MGSQTFRWTTVYPKKYAHGFVVFCFVVVTQSFIMNSHEVFIHIHQGCFAGTGAIVRLPQCQWSKPDRYGKISQCIATTKHSKAKTVCIFLGIYCTHPCCSRMPMDYWLRWIHQHLLITLLERHLIKQIKSDDNEAKVVTSRGWLPIILVEWIDITIYCRLWWITLLQLSQWETYKKKHSRRNCRMTCERFVFGTVYVDFKARISNLYKHLLASWGPIQRQMHESLEVLDNVIGKTNNTMILWENNVYLSRVSAVFLLLMNSSYMGNN